MKKLAIALAILLAAPVALAETDYYIIRPDGVLEVREVADNSDGSKATLPAGAVVVTDAQAKGLISGALIVQNGQIVTNPNPPNI